MGGYSLGMVKPRGSLHCEFLSKMRSFLEYYSDQYTILVAFSPESTCSAPQSNTVLPEAKAHLRPLKALLGVLPCVTSPLPSVSKASGDPTRSNQKVDVEETTFSAALNLVWIPDVERHQ